MCIILQFLPDGVILIPIPSIRGFIIMSSCITYRILTVVMWQMWIFPIGTPCKLQNYHSGAFILSLNSVTSAVITPRSSAIIVDSPTADFMPWKNSMPGPLYHLPFFAVLSPACTAQYAEMP